MSAFLLSDPVDHIKLAGLKSPGLCDIIGAKREYDYSVRQPPFSSGALIVFKRVKLCEFDVRLRLYTATDLVELDMWRTVLAPPGKRGKAQSLDIWHPLLESLDIKSVVVKSVSQLEQIDDGVWAITIKFLENRGLPKQSLAKVESSKAVPLDPVEKAILSQDREIEKLVEQLAQ